MNSQAAQEITVPDADALVRAALAGDRIAEREVCARLMPAMRAFAARRLRPSSVEDFVHDSILIFVEAMRRGRIIDEARVASFALGICRNLARERARTSERRRELSERYGITLDDLLLWQEGAPVQRHHLEDCFSQLTDRARRVLRATFCEDESDSVIAGTLSMSESNVRTTRHRSLAALRACLERPLCYEEGSK